MWVIEKTCVVVSGMALEHPVVSVLSVSFVAFVAFVAPLVFVASVVPAAATSLLGGCAGITLIR